MRLLILIALLTLASATVAQDGYWFERADMLTPCQEVLPGSLNGRIVVAGGWTSGSAVTSQVQVFNPATNSWTWLTPLPKRNHHGALAEVDGLLYLVGGYTNIAWPVWEATDTLLVYDPATFAWSVKADMLVGRGEHAIAVYDDRIFAFGGNDIDGRVVGAVEVYDPATDSWTALSPMPTPRHHLATAVVDTLIFCVGGRQGAWGETYTMIASVEAYSPASDTWYSYGDMPNPRGGLSAAGKDGKLYIFGGEIPGIFSNVEEFDPATNNWRDLTAMLTPRHGTGAVMIGDTVFVIGGSIQSGVVPDNSNEGFVLGTCADSDLDGYADSDDPANSCPVDNCPDVANPDQRDRDNDGIGDACDECTDSDNDGYGDTGAPPNLCPTDNCPDVYNPGQENADGDAYGDLCDNCPDDATKVDPGICGCNVSDTDSDGDTTPDCLDICLGFDDGLDMDADGHPDGCDNCPEVYNPDQLDQNGNDIGDLCDGCCVGVVGDANNSGDDEPTIGDVSTMIDAKFGTGTCDGIIECLTEADINLSAELEPICDDITIGDISQLVDYLFIKGPAAYGPLPDCP